MSVFIDRLQEISILQKRYKSKKAELIVLYGRRRVGKSELIENFLAGNGIYGLRLLAREESKKFQLMRFTKKLAEFFSDPVLENISFNDWDGFFEYIISFEWFGDLWEIITGTLSTGFEAFTDVADSPLTNFWFWAFYACLMAGVWVLPSRMGLLDYALWEKFMYSIIFFIIDWFIIARMTD